jgi:hypothetical protein
MNDVQMALLNVSSRGFAEEAKNRIVGEKQRFD